MSSKFLSALAWCLLLSLPAYAQKADSARGLEVFKANCQMCHPGGDNALEPTRPLKGAAFAKRYPTDESIAKRIREGSANGRMPAFPKSGLRDTELVDVIQYIRSLTPAPKRSGTTTRPVTRPTKCLPTKK